MRPMRPPNVTSIIQDGGRGSTILLPVFYLLMPQYSEGQNLSTNQISSTYLNSWLKYNYFHFGKTNARPQYLNSTSDFNFGLYWRNWHAIIAEIRRHIDFLRWRMRPLNTTSGFIFVGDTSSEGQCLSANQISSTYLNSWLEI